MAQIPIKNECSWKNKKQETKNSWGKFKPTIKTKSTLAQNIGKETVE